MRGYGAASHPDERARRGGWVAARAPPRPLRVRELIRTNLDALYSVTKFLERHRILLYQSSSNVVPFASHPVNQLQWWEEFARELATYGERLRALDVRVSTHPGQFTGAQFTSPAVVTAVIA